MINAFKAKLRQIIRNRSDKYQKNFDDEDARLEEAVGEYLNNGKYQSKLTEINDETMINIANFYSQNKADLEIVVEAMCAKAIYDMDAVRWEAYRGALLDFFQYSRECWIEHQMRRNPDTLSVDENQE